MGLFGKICSATLMVCVCQFLHSQEALQESRQASQQQEQQVVPAPWTPQQSVGETSTPDLIGTVGGPAPLTSTSPHAAPAIAEVQDSFKVYPVMVDGEPLPTTGKWTVPSTPGLAFLPACKASKASCLEVEYNVASRKIACRWTVLFPAPVVVKGKKIQTPTVINEDENAAKYTMMVRLQTGMNYAALKTRAPVYPSGAKKKDWTGSVSLDLVISPQGKVVLIPGIRGPALLRTSAKQAVERWIYAPTKLGGQDIARSFTVQVNYSVGGETIKRN